MELIQDGIVKARLAISASGSYAGISFIDVVFPVADSFLSRGFIFFINSRESVYVEKSGFSEQTEKPKIQKEAEKNGFVPLTNFENVKNVSEKEAVSPESIPSSSVSRTNFNSENIDTLPDIGDLAFENETESDSESENYDEPENNSDYVPLGNKKSESSHEVKDAALIAKAISSVLSGENSE